MLTHVFTVQDHTGAVVLAGASEARALALVGAEHRDTLRAMNPAMRADCRRVLGGYVVHAREPQNVPGPAPLVTQGRGGWAIHWGAYVTPGGTHIGSSTLSGYGDDWRTYVHAVASDAPYVDTRAIPDDRIVYWAQLAPMPNPDVPRGIARGFGGDRPLDERTDNPCADAFRGARGMDYVNPLDYAEMAADYGAYVTLAHELAREPVAVPAAA